MSIIDNDDELLFLSYKRLEHPYRVYPKEEFDIELIADCERTFRFKIDELRILKDVFKIPEFIAPSSGHKMGGLNCVALLCRSKQTD